MNNLIYKIGIAGSHCVGKSTLTDVLKGALKQRDVEPHIVPEASTLARERGLPINENTTFSAQYHIFHTQCANEVIYAESNRSPPNFDIIICDRTVVDNLGYFENKFGTHSLIRDNMKNHLQYFPYDIIYYVPIINNYLSSNLVVGNGIRSINLVFQKQLDKIIRSLFHELSIPYVELPVPNDSHYLHEEWNTFLLNKTLKDLEKKLNRNFPQSFYK